MNLTHGMEALYVVAWLAGLGLFWLRTRRAFLLGAYFGCSLSMGYDWLLSSSRVWNLQFDPTTVHLFSWYGIGQPLWGPVSYGVFYGLILFAWVLQVERIRKLGVWAYAALFPAIFLVNVIAEGSIISLSGAYRYGLPATLLVFHVPWMHFLTTGIMAAGIVGLCGGTYSLLRDVGWDDLSIADPVDAAVGRHRAMLIALGVALPQAAYYASLLAAFTLYSAMGLGNSQG